MISSVPITWRLDFAQKYKLLCHLESSWFIFLTTLKNPNKLLVIFWFSPFQYPQVLKHHLNLSRNMVHSYSSRLSICLNVFIYCVFPSRSWLSNNAVWIKFTLDLLIHTLVRIKINCTSASVDIPGWFFPSLICKCIFSVFSFAGWGTHFRAPKHVYMKWHKGEEVSGKKPQQFSFL